ncbi:hypothetical protein FA132_35080, partial [Pseudomonas aeruginosa]|nr:hypothetical protein [Pseudomonas aeruginosa]
GRISVESVVRCSWNGWPDDRGIRTIGYAIGSFLTGSEMASEYVATSDGVTDFCSQVCGGGQCGTGPSCHLGIDPVTRQPATMVPAPAGSSQLDLLQVA